MTRNYEALAVAEPVFGELRNCMELAIVGVLVTRGTPGRAKPVYLAASDEDSLLKTAELTAPTQVESKVSMLKKGRNWVISASGVTIRPSEIVGRAQTGNAPGLRVSVGGEFCQMVLELNHKTSEIGGSSWNSAHTLLFVSQFSG